jgi:hypothetical protein
MPVDAGCFSTPFDVPAYRLSGTVYAALLNRYSVLSALGEERADLQRAGGELFLEPKNVCVSLGAHPIPHWGART